MKTVNPLTKYVFQLKTTTIDGVEEYNYISTAVSTDLGKYVFSDGTGSIQVIDTKISLSNTTMADNNQIFYFIAEDLFQI